MRLLLDAMWPPEISHQLRTRGHDVVAIVERGTIRTAADLLVFTTAQAEGRALLTEDVRGSRVIAARFIATGGVHSGLVFTDNRHLPRSRAGTLGRVVTTLDALLKADPNLSNREYWLS